MFSKKYNKGETLPFLKTYSNSNFTSSRVFSNTGSPIRDSSLAEIQESDKVLTNTRHTPSTFTFSQLQLRSSSLVNQQSDKKSLSFLNPEPSPSNNQLGYVKREENRKKVAVWEKLGQLKNSLSKYQDSGESIVIPTRSDVRKIINCLELLNDVNSGLAELMNIVIKVLKGALFVNPLIIEPYEEKLYEDCDEELKNVMQNCQKESIPYSYLCMVLLKELTHNPKREQKIQQKTYEIHKLQGLLDENRHITDELNRRLRDRISPKEHEDLLTEIESYKEAFSGANKDYDGLKTTHNSLIEENLSLKRQIDHDVNEIEKHIVQIQALEKAKENVIKETEGSRQQIAVMKEKIKGFKDTLDKIIIKLGNLKHQVNDLRTENEELVYKNQKLSIRTAVGYDALTPRPDYKRLQEEKKIDIEIFDQTGRRQIVSTIKVVDELLGRMQTNTEETQRDSSYKRGTKGMFTKIAATNAFRNSIQGVKHLSLAPQTAKSITSIHDVTQKSFFAKEAPSQNNVTEGGTKEEGVPSRQNVGNEEGEEKTDEMQQLGFNHSKSSIAKIGKEGDRSVRKEANIESGFGAETIKEANNLINFVVETKKEIDKFD